MCGIAGIINKNLKDFDYTTFCTLGIANDSRGGDSCGIYIDGVYDYGVNKEKLFINYFIENEFLSKLDKAQISLLHCRKASVGKINKESAQPIIITNSNSEVEYVMVHNGTIHNYEELAEKYIPNINIKDLTDSQVLAQICYHKGYDVLNEYVGGTAFVAIDYRNDIPFIYLFHGKSKKYYYSNEAEIERPLYYTFNENTNELIFSSIYQYLYSLRKNQKVYSLQPNILWEFNGDGFKQIKNYPRTKILQTITNNWTSPYYYNAFYNGSSCSSEYLTDYIGVDIQKNIYDYRNAPLHGKYYLTRSGYKSPTPSKYYSEVWFFNGVLLKSRDCFEFLSNLSLNPRYKNIKSDDLNNIIRFLSVDGIYKYNNKWYKAISPLKRKLYSGDLIYYTVRQYNEIKDGVVNIIHQSQEFNDFPQITENINFKKVLKECMSLMN